MEKTIFENAKEVLSEASKAELLKLVKTITTLSEDDAYTFFAALRDEFDSLANKNIKGKEDHYDTMADAMKSFMDVY